MPSSAFHALKYPKSFRLLWGPLIRTYQHIPSSPQLSIHSVFALSVMHGTPRMYASFWIPSESVNIKSGKNKTPANDPLEKVIRESSFYGLSDQTILISKDKIEIL
jgi:hypothetical protein